MDNPVLKNAAATATGRAIVAMSGGVDSSVAALLSVESGLDCVGCTMRLFRNEDIGESPAKACCAAADAEDARAAADALGIPFYVFNFADTFKERVIGRFVKSYQNGETPNPCIDCNRYLKFDRLLRRAEELGRDYVVTGHYARIEADAGGGRYILKKGVDLSKDQSYVLYAMTQKQLKHTQFPLGNLRKAQVREMAAARGLANAKKPDSQDLCFVRRGGYADFIRQYVGEEPPAGCFVDTAGNVIGKHRGIINYTIGQRRGLNLPGAEPVYVCAINPADNTVTVGQRQYLYAKTLTARDINLIAVDRLDAPVRVCAKVRYNQTEQPATVMQTGPDTLQVEFDSPQKAITTGQAVVLYSGDVVIGGGTVDTVGSRNLRI
jgi:tRNA-specific 2-thiouridylase